MPRAVLVLAATLLAAGCAARKAPRAPQPGPIPPPQAVMAAPIDHEGDSPETAVSVPADAPNEGVDFENRWIYDRYGRFRRHTSGIAHAGEGSARRMYEVVTIELADHRRRTVYFDITENWSAWQAPAR